VLLLLAAGAWVWPARAQQAAPAAKTSRPVQARDCFVVLMDEVKLSLERPGILSNISVREGDTIAEGQNLALLRDDVARAALAVAEEEASSDVDIRYAQKASEVAQVEYEKTAEVNLRLPKTIPELEVLRARLAWDKTLLETEKAEHTHQVNILKRDEAKVQLQTYRIDAPFDGFVTRVYFSRGASIKQGDPVIELVSTKKVKVEGSISLLDALSVRPGTPVEVQIVLPGETAGKPAATELQKRKFSGKLVFVDVVTKKLESTVRVWAEVENVDNALRAGLKAVMTILPSTE
jgi:multidrug efflux system membrane fusion protein